MLAVQIEQLVRAILNLRCNYFGLELLLSEVNAVRLIMIQPPLYHLELVLVGLGLDLVSQFFLKYKLLLALISVLLWIFNNCVSV